MSTTTQETTITEAASPTVVKYGDYSFDVSTLPTNTVMALIRRGVAHFLGNEQASKVSTWKDANTKDGVAPTDAAIAAFKADCMKAAVAAMNDGTIGSSIRGPRGTALDTVIRGLAETEVRNILKHNGLTMPSGEKTISFPGGPDGKPLELTRGQLIDRRIANHGDRLKKEAEAKMAADERKAKREVEAAKAAGGKGAEALGL